MVLPQVFQKQFLELTYFRCLDLVKIPSNSSLDDASLIFRTHRFLLLLLQQLSQLSTSIQLLLGGCIQVRTELCKCCYFSLLRQFQFQRTRHLLHSLDLSCRSDSAHRQTDVDCRSDTSVEQLGFEEDLTICDGNHVGGDER